MATEQQRDALLEKLRQMSAADLSILEAVKEELGGESPVMVTTTPGSDNDLLWSEMVNLGWMTPGQALEVPVASKVFVVNNSAKEDLEALLTALKRDELPTIFSDLRREIPQNIVPRVIAAGGTPADVAMMLAGIVERTMRRWIRPELHEEFLDDISRKVRALMRE